MQGLKLGQREGQGDHEAWEVREDELHDHHCRKVQLVELCLHLWQQLEHLELAELEHL